MTDYQGPDWKPERRIVDIYAGNDKLRAEGKCRLCGAAAAIRGLTRHHLVPRGQRGDDISDNIIPLCGDGTRGCHAEVEYRTKGYRPRLRRKLTADELAYIIDKKGASWLNSPRGYPRDD